MASQKSPAPDAPLPDSVDQIIHELRVHQIELAIQNEDLRNTQEKLEASRSKYFQLYDLAPVGYVTVSQKGLITEANLTAATLLGVHRKSLVTFPLSRFILPDDQDIYYKHRQLLFKTGEPQVCEIRMFRSDTDFFWARMEAKVMNDQEGIPVCRAVIIDITEKKQMQEEKERLLNQLFEKQKMESVGRLAGGVAHDFNNMLMVIIGNTEMALAETDPSSPIYPYLQAANESAVRSASLTSQLLAFARKQTIAPRNINLNDMIAGMVKMLQRLIGENIELTFHPGDALWPVIMDPSQIDQILVNLAVNARDAISGVGQLTIDTRNIPCSETSGLFPAETLPGDFVLMEIRDSGKGMEKEMLSHIFEPFYTTKKMGEGTGLGLATIYGIVKQNNGFITVTSRENLGTTFFIYLPRSHAPQNEDHVRCMEKPGRGSETVLMVEDELSILRLGTIILNNFGYTVLTARSPNEALSLAETYTKPIHLLITDVIMPQMNGKDLYEKILSLRPGIKTLFMSGYTDDIIAEHGVLDKGLHFLQKPFSTRTLAATVREILDNPDASTSPAT